MSNSEAFERPGQQSATDLPFVDLLYYETELRAFVVSLVPSEDVSTRQKETVNIPLDSPEGRQIGAQLFFLSQLLGRGAVVVRIIHGGGANYGFHFANGAYVELRDDDLSSGQNSEAHEAVRRIGQSAESAFKATHVSAHRA